MALLKLIRCPIYTKSGYFQWAITLQLGVNLSLDYNRVLLKSVK